MNETELLARYRPWLRKVARNWLSERPGVEDLAQEGWVAMWKSIPLSDGTAPLDWWLKRHALFRMRQCLRNWHDTAKQRQHVFTDDVAVMVELTVELGEIELAYHHGEIARAVSALSPREREYVVMRFWGGMSPALLTAHFGYPPHGLWRTARPKLAAQLAHLGVTG